MSRIDELIREFCPNGVRHMELGAVTYENRERNADNNYSEVRSVTNSGGLVRTSDFFENARTSADTRNYKVVRPGMFAYNPSRINVGSIGWLDEAAPVVVSPMYVVFGVDSARIMPEYLQLYFSSGVGRRRIEGKTEVGARFRLTYQSLATIQLPVPPLDVQREIVKVINKFTELEAELGAELEARRRQYQYYRDTLLAFEGQDVRWTTMAEVGEFFRGRRFTKNDLNADGLACIHYGDIYTQYGTATTATVSHVRSDMASTLRFAKHGDLVVAGVGETVEDVGKAVAWLGDGEVAIHDDCFAFRHSLNPKFVSYYFQTAAFHAEKNKFVARAKVKRLSAENLGKLAIPVPPPDEQERIVIILDKFDALVNDISGGLPAEIAARRKQYEHYRDRLLTFREAA